MSRDRKSIIFVCQFGLMVFETLFAQAKVSILLLCAPAVGKLKGNCQQTVLAVGQLEELLMELYELLFIISDLIQLYMVPR